MRFADIEGYYKIKQRFITLRDVGKLPHCQLLYGDESRPTFSLALAFIKYIFCAKPIDGDSCGSCIGCKKMDNLSHPDLYFIPPRLSTASSDSKKYNQFIEFLLKNTNPTLKDWSAFLSSRGKVLNIVKEDAYDLSGWMSMRVINSTCKVCVIWLPEQMTVAAGNSFLKILEEPPINSMFFLLSQDKDGILPTILSRAQQIYIVPPIDKSEHLRLEVGEESEVEEDRFFKFKEWIRGCYKKDVVKLCSMAEEFQKNSIEEQKSFLRYSSVMLKHICMIKIGLRPKSGVDAEEMLFLENLVKSTQESNINLAAIVKLIDKNTAALDRNANSKILFLNLSLALSW